MSERKEGYYCVRLSSQLSWAIGLWVPQLGRWHFATHGGTMPDVHEVGRRIDPEPEITYGGPAPVTLADVVRVANAARRDDDPSVMQLDIQADGRLFFRQGGVTFERLGSGREAQRKLRSAVAHLDSKPERTLLDVMRTA